MRKIDLLHLFSGLLQYHPLFQRDLLQKGLKLGEIGAGERCQKMIGGGISNLDSHCGFLGRSVGLITA